MVGKWRFNPSVLCAKGDMSENRQIMIKIAEKTLSPNIQRSGIKCWALSESKKFDTITVMIVKNIHFSL